ncbi:uncharacterized protein TNCV_3646111 [Trichonephila clavipes]|nr:uncharacterized protein TNCV_3646111 [Trichonephila clavipes]
MGNYRQLRSFYVRDFFSPSRSKAKTVHSSALFLVYRVLCVKPPSVLCATPLHSLPMKGVCHVMSSNLVPLKTGDVERLSLDMSRLKLLPLTWCGNLEREIGRAEVDLPLRRFRRKYEQLSQFERGRIIGIMEAGWSARQVARQLGSFECVVRRCWDQRIREMSFTR